MSYFYSKILKVDFNAAIEQATAALKTEGFGVLTDIDVQQTFKNKLDVDFKKYRILGACNPHFAHQAITQEDKIGVFLPCNVVVQEHSNGDVEVSAVSPKASMQAVENPSLADIANEVEEKLKKVMDSI